MKYLFNHGFSPFALDYKGRDGALHIKPGRVFELTNSDVKELSRSFPLVMAKASKLPEPELPKREPKKLKVEEAVEPEVKPEVKAVSKKDKRKSNKDKDLTSALYSDQLKDTF